MGRMAASIAHEINQPLAAVVANGNAGRAPWIEHEPLRDFAEWKVLASHYQAKLDRKRAAAQAEVQRKREALKGQSGSSSKAA
jgi:hypothetical protein